MQSVGHWRKNRFASLDTKTIPKKDSSYFGNSLRFTEQEKAVKQNPGPGQYKDLNRWNKRTFNVNFLNVQSYLNVSPSGPR